MVFNVQSRDAAAVHAKLGELIHAVEAPDKGLTGPWHPYPMSNFN